MILYECRAYTRYFLDRNSKLDHQTPLLSSPLLSSPPLPSPPSNVSKNQHQKNCQSAPAHSLTNSHKHSAVPTVRYLNMHLDFSPVSGESIDNPPSCGVGNWYQYSNMIQYKYGKSVPPYSHPMFNPVTSQKKHQTSQTLAIRPPPADFDLHLTQEEQRMMMLWCMPKSPHTCLLAPFILISKGAQRKSAIVYSSIILVPGCRVILHAMVRMHGGASSYSSTRAQ